MRARARPPLFDHMAEAEAEPEAPGRRYVIRRPPFADIGRLASIRPHRMCRRRDHCTLQDQTFLMCSSLWTITAHSAARVTITTFGPDHSLVLDIDRRGDNELGFEALPKPGVLGQPLRRVRRKRLINYCARPVDASRRMIHTTLRCLHASPGHHLLRTLKQPSRGRQTQLQGRPKISAP